MSPFQPPPCPYMRFEDLPRERLVAALRGMVELLVQTGRPTPADACSSFAEVAALHGIPKSLARAAAPFAVLRNRLVHEYEALDDARVHAAIRGSLDVFARFVAALRTTFCGGVSP